MAFAQTDSVLYDAMVGVPGQSQAVGYKSPKGVYGKYRIIPVEYAIPSSALPAAGDIIYLAKLNPSARVIAGLSRVQCEAVGTTFTAVFGDLSNPRRYSGALDLHAASSGVGGGAIEFCQVAGKAKEQFVPIGVKPLPINPVIAAPPAWVTGTTYNIGDRVTSSSLSYVCLVKHVAGTFATDLTNLLWVLSASYQPWVTSTSYVIGDAVIINGAYYVCVVAHTSGTFATDLASADWVAVTPDETIFIMQCVSSSTLTQGAKILILLAVIDE
jgi:hypothetical protein